MNRSEPRREHPSHVALVAFVAEFSDVEEALEEAVSVAETLAALDRSSCVFSTHAAVLEAAGAAAYDTASEILLEFRRRAFEQVVLL